MAVVNFKGNMQVKPMEYAVYIYHRPTNENNKDNYWERKSITSDLRRAKRKAKILHQSQKYEKVELQRTSFNRKEHCKQNTVLKVYDRYLEKSSSKIALVVFGMFGLLMLAISAYILL